MGLGNKRMRALYGILHKVEGVHRYTRWRWAVGLVGTLGVALMAVTKTLRFDLWGGEHYYRGEQVPFLDAARMFAYWFLGVNIVIILASRLVGRYLCGFACPVGSLARLGEWANFAERKAAHRILAPLVILFSSFVLSAITFSFWVNWRVFQDGSPSAMGSSGGVILGMTLGLHVVISRIGLGFCRNWCPSGVYFAVLGQETSSGITFHEDECTDCGVCTVVCPMDLDPKEMSGGKYRDERGLYGSHMSNFALCIRCGDCVVGCEEVGTAKQITTALTLGTLAPDQRESRDMSAFKREQGKSR
ncbi:MAG: polyferredoxin [Planctomycetota bacterium]|jgi:polyferredoxin